MSLALLFPGQGTQHAGMLPWLEAHAAARPVLARMADLLAAPDWRERLADAPWAQSNPVAQPLLTGVSLAAWAVLAPGLPAPAAVLGYSVGELPAGAVAGLYDVDAALALAQARAACMDAAAPAQPTGLLSVGGLPWQVVADQVAADGLHPSIVREADQLLLGGPVTALHAWAPRLEAQGARCTPIGARIASHTPWLAAAVPPWRAHLQAQRWRPPQTALVANATARVEWQLPALQEAMAVQPAQLLRFDLCLGALAERGPRCVLEVGPCTTLSRLWNRLHPDVPARSLEDFQGPEGVWRWVERCLGG
ncbi:acyltransferase domain-containing protein [Ideonella oryzae]|uniref:Acyltransferase domain-containing protein n=1 Tax=Ideonella oryzae TaxID=2937441 RepID=A0ABT1BH91_9BURK|nr:acyltransferase domain-containing protein [Ideonella oryzae]